MAKPCNSFAILNILHSSLSSLDRMRPAGLRLKHAWAHTVSSTPATPCGSYHMAWTRPTCGIADHGWSHDAGRSINNLDLWHLNCIAIVVLCEQCCSDWAKANHRYCYQTGGNHA